MDVASGRRTRGVSLALLLLAAACIAGVAGGMAPRAVASRHAAARSAAAPLAAWAPVRFVRTLDEADAADPWTQLRSAFETVRLTEQMLLEADSLRAIAAALASTHDAKDGSPPQYELAAGELALADKVLEVARLQAANARAAFQSAWESAQRANDETPVVPQDGLHNALELRRGH